MTSAARRETVLFLWKNESPKELGKASPSPNRILIDVREPLRTPLHGYDPQLCQLPITSAPNAWRDIITKKITEGTPAPLSIHHLKHHPCRFNGDKPDTFMASDDIEFRTTENHEIKLIIATA
jgi:hypothetical protein